MAVFGTTDAAAFSNTVAVTQNDATVTKNAADTVVGGDVLEISGVNYIVKLSLIHISEPTRPY